MQKELYQMKKFYTSRPEGFFNQLSKQKELHQKTKYIFGIRKSKGFDKFKGKNSANALI